MYLYYGYLVTDVQKKQVKLSPGNLERLGKKGTCEDDRDSAFTQLLDLDDDVNRCIEGEEPKTEKLQKLQRKWYNEWQKR